MEDLEEYYQRDFQILIEYCENYEEIFYTNIPTHSHRSHLLI